MFRTRGSDGEHDAGVPLSEDTRDEYLLGTVDRELQFTDLYRAARGPVRRYLQRMVGVEDADDLTEDVFATVWSRWSAVPAEPERWNAWVFGVARFKVQETIRSRRYRRGLFRQMATRRVDAAVPAPDDAVIALQRVQSTLMLLPASERDALTLVVFGGLSSTEAADVLNCSASAVTSRVSRGRQRLKQILSTEEEVQRETR